MPPRPVGLQNCFQDEKKIVPGVVQAVFGAAVDEDGAFAGGGDFELSDELFALEVVRCAFVVIVEADLTAGDDFGLGEEAVEFGERGFVGITGIVWIDAGAGEEARHAGLAVERAAEIEGLMHLGGIFADADGENRDDACFFCAREHVGAVFVVARAVEMGVGVDEQRVLDLAERHLQGWTTFRPSSRSNGSKSTSQCSRRYPPSMQKVAKRQSTVPRTVMPSARKAR